jgi:hypothetical protein
MRITAAETEDPTDRGIPAAELIDVLTFDHLSLALHLVPLAGAAG